MDFASAQQLLGPGFMSTPPQPPVVPTPMQQPPPMMAPPTSSSSSPSSNNSLKKGPQVLIKNVNGKVVITPIAETQPAAKKVGVNINITEIDKLDHILLLVHNGNLQ